MSKLGIVVTALLALTVGCSSENVNHSDDRQTQEALETTDSNPLTDTAQGFQTFTGSGLSVGMASAVVLVQPNTDVALAQNPFVLPDSELNTAQPVEQTSATDLASELSDEDAGDSLEIDSAPTSLAETSVPVVETKPDSETIEPVASAAIDSGLPVGTQPVAGDFLPTSIQVEETLSGSDISSPSYKSSTIETSSGVLITQVSQSSDFNGNATHQYSKRAAWNANETLMEIGDAAVDVESLAIINPYVPVSTARVWSNLQPDIMYGIRFNPDPNEFVALNVRTNEHRVVRRFDAYNRCSLGNSEGTLTNGDSKIVIACDERSTGQKVLIAYDILRDEILGILRAESNYNWAGFSQSGDFIVVENNKYPDTNAHILVYDETFGNARHLGSPGHGDFGFDVSGDEVYVMIRWDVIWYVRLRDGHRVELSISDSDNPIGHGHISCRNLDRPGWCYFSAEKDSRLGAVRISESESAVEHWGFHRSSINSYAAQPKASVSRSGKQLIYSSDWFGGEDLADYVMSLAE